MSRNFLSGKICFSCHASVFAYSCQINNISCWVIGNKCKKFWSYDANPYSIISTLLHNGFSKLEKAELVTQQSLWVHRGSWLCGHLRSCLRLHWGWETPGAHNLPICLPTGSVLLVQASLLCKTCRHLGVCCRGVSELWRNGDGGQGGSMESQCSKGGLALLSLQSHRSAWGLYQQLPPGQKSGLLLPVAVTVTRSCCWGVISMAVEELAANPPGCLQRREVKICQVAKASWFWY